VRATPRPLAASERALNVVRFPDGVQHQAYYATSGVLHASDFGVPQTRKRLFIIALRRDVAEAVGIRSDADVATVFPAPTTLSPVSIRSALAGLQQSKREIDPWRRVAMTTSLGRAIRRLPRNPIKLTRPCHVDPDDDRDFTLTRCAWDLPAPTLTVSGQGPNALGNAIHPAEDRKFTIPELKRLSALPDDFVLTGTLAQAAERVCRMVPPPLTRAIARSVYDRVLQRLS
jgi:site-specific DNA-cytosine methylase